MSINENDLKNKYSNNRHTINDVIIFLSNSLKLSQKELVESTGIDKSKMSRFFNKKEIPNKDHLEKLALPLKVSKETLWIISGDMLPPDMESTITKEILNIEKIITRQKNALEEDLGINIDFTTKEKQLLQEFIGYLKYRRQNERN